MYVIRCRHKQNIGLMAVEDVLPHEFTITGFYLTIRKVVCEPIDDFPSSSALLTPRPNGTYINFDVRHVGGQMTHSDAGQSTGDPAPHEVLKALPNDVVKEHAATNNGNFQCSLCLAHLLSPNPLGSTKWSTGKQLSIVTENLSSVQ